MAALLRVINLISREENALQPHQLMARGDHEVELLGSDKAGFIAMGILALISWVSSFALLSFLTYRFIFWQRYYKRPLAENQYVVLIYNLLLVDLQQASAFLICLHWVTRDSVNFPSAACVLQGWWIQIADPGSGLFVLAIAVHTADVVLRGRQLPFKGFVACVCGLWAFIIMLGLIPVGMFTSNTFVVSEAGWVGFSNFFSLFPCANNLAVLAESRVRNRTSLGSLSLDFHFGIRNSRAVRFPVHLPSSPNEAGLDAAPTTPRQPEAPEPCRRVHGYLPVCVRGFVSSTRRWSYGHSTTCRSQQNLFRHRRFPDGPFGIHGCSSVYLDPSSLADRNR